MVTPKADAGAIDESPASERVFAVAELLEAALICLPLRDTLLAQRISKTFKNTIDGSTRLQQALFFSPTPPGDMPRINDLFFNSNTFDKFLPLVHFGSIVFMSELPAHGVHLRLSSTMIRCDEETPCHNILIVKLSGRSRDACHRYLAEHDFLLVDDRTNTDCAICDGSIKAEGGSWKRMYASQPPMSVYWMTSNRRLQYADVKSPEGKKLGELIRCEPTLPKPVWVPTAVSGWVAVEEDVAKEYVGVKWPRTRG